MGINHANKKTIQVPKKHVENPLKEMPVDIALTESGRDDFEYYDKAQLKQKTKRYPPNHHMNISKKNDTFL